MSAQQTLVEAPRKLPESAQMQAGSTPADLLRIAVTQGADITQLEKLMELQLRWEANEARKAFVAAMAAFKANPPQITKNKPVSFGTTSYQHATLDHVCEAVTKALSEHGISHRWKVDQDEKGISVTCILTHDKGHSEETRLSAPADTSGSKNAIQAIGSSVTYLERYTLLAATGLAAANSDNDGRSMSMGDVSERVEWISNARNLAELNKLFADAANKALDAADKNAVAALKEARDKKKKDMGW